MTLKEIAQELGLSLNTVSDVLNGGDTRYSVKTRQRIHETAKRLGYRVNLQASILAGAKSGMIGIIKTINFHQGGIERALYAGDAIHRNKYKILSHDILWHNDGLESAISTMLASRAEGLIFDGVGSECRKSASFKRLLKSELPMVSMTPADLPNVSCVTSDYYQGCWDLVSHLLSLGHTNFAFIAPKSNCENFYAQNAARPAAKEWVTSSIGLRLNAYRDRLLMEEDRCRYRIIPESPLPTELQLDSIAYHPTYRAVKAMLQGGDVPQALLCLNDYMTIGAIRACSEFGIKVPEDVAIVGFDNVEIGAFFSPSLTSVSLNTKMVAEAAVELLLRKIRGEVKERQLIKIPCELIVRESCGAAGVLAS